MNKLSLLMPLLALVLAVGYVEYRMPAQTSGPAAPTSDLADLKARVASHEKLIREQAGRRPSDLRPLDNFDDVLETPTEPLEPTAAAEPPEDEAKLPPDEKSAAIDEILALVASGRATEPEISRLWNLLPGSGRELDALKAFQAHLEDHPNDPDAQYGVGVAAISKLVGGNLSYMEQGTYSDLAQKAFERTLELDDNHFAARFSQAISYTHWPDAFGKGPAAIKEFEVLRERHRGDTSIGEMEEVYRNLVVQYRKLGQDDKAREAVEEGLQSFPDSASLLEQMESMEK